MQWTRPQLFYRLSHPDIRIGLGQLRPVAEWTPSRSYRRPSIAPTPVVDVKHIARNPGLYAQNTSDRNSQEKSTYPWQILELVKKRSDLVKSLKEGRDARARITRALANAQKQSDSDHEYQERLRQAKTIKEDLSHGEAEEARINSQIEELALSLPNLTSPHTPTGDQAKTLKICLPPEIFATNVSDDNGSYILNYEEFIDEEEQAKNKITKLTEPVNQNSHTAIGLEHGLLDFDSAAATSGWGWYFLRNEAALLEQALIQFSIQTLIKRGFQIVSAPSMVYSHIASACGFQPRDQSGEQQIYNIEQNDRDEGKPSLSLAATAEIPLAGTYAAKSLDGARMPIKTAAVSRCHRAEAGARGLDTKGLYRVHAFTKIEMFAWTLPDSEGEGLGESEAKSQSDVVFEEMMEIQQEILKSLGLIFRVCEMPSHDLGSPASRKQDIEVYFPSRRSKNDGWGEVTSTSTCTDYQTRRLATRVRLKDSSLAWPYTLNGTALAIPRIIAALLEMGYNPDKRTIYYPNVLRPWMST